MYLDDISEKHYEFKVITYTDHKRDRLARYFNDYKEALEHWKFIMSLPTNANYTASAAIIRVSTGEPLVRQTWRV